MDRRMDSAFVVNITTSEYLVRVLLVRGKRRGGNGNGLLVARHLCPNLGSNVRDLFYTT